MEKKNEIMAQRNQKVFADNGKPIPPDAELYPKERERRHTKYYLKDDNGIEREVVTQNARTKRKWKEKKLANAGSQSKESSLKDQKRSSFPAISESSPSKRRKIEPEMPVVTVEGPVPLDDYPDESQAIVAIPEQKHTSQLLDPSPVPNLVSAPQLGADEKAQILREIRERIFSVGSQEKIYSNSMMQQQTLFGRSVKTPGLSKKNSKEAITIDLVEYPHKNF